MLIFSIPDDLGKKLITAICSIFSTKELSDSSVTSYGYYVESDGINVNNFI